MLRYEPTTECKFYSKCQSAKHGKQPNWVAGKKFPTRFTKSKNGTRGKNSSKWKKMKSQHLYLFFLAFVADICICIYIYIYICLIGGFAASSKNSSAVFPQTKLHFFNVCNLKGHAKRCVFLRFSLVSLVFTSGCR